MDPFNTKLAASTGYLTKANSFNQKKEKTVI